MSTTEKQPIPAANAAVIADCIKEQVFRLAALRSLAQGLFRSGGALDAESLANVITSMMTCAIDDLERCTLALDPEFGESGMAGDPLNFSSEMQSREDGQ